MTEENSSRNDKIKKIEALKEQGIEPFPYTYPVNAKLKDIKAKYEDKIAAHEQTEDYFNVAGRIMLYRDMGGLCFMTIQDEDDKLQIAFMKKELGDKFKLLRYFEMGDIIGVHGKVFKTKLGELSLLVDEFQMLSKCLSDLGDKYHGVTDIETKYRNRSLDMIMNSNSKKILKQRFLIMQKTREFMNKEQFLEIETPITQVMYGGAAAKPFITHHNDLDMNLYLRVSPEQYLKRVMVGGMESIYEINKNFRNESIDKTHNPEFTMMEAYKAYVDYNYMMSLTERLVEYVALEVLGTTELEFRGQKFSVKAPWKRVTVKDALEKGTGWKLDKMSDKELFDEVRKIGKTAKQLHKTRGEAILILFEEFGEPTAKEPTHFIDYPSESTIFCKKKRGDDKLIERFETFVCGMELANSYSELNDAQLQRKHMEEQSKFKADGAEETWGELDEDFLEAMDLGLPPAGGVGIGIDRMVMVLLNQESIRDIIYFPTMKPKRDEETKG